MRFENEDGTFFFVSLTPSGRVRKNGRHRKRPMDIFTPPLILRNHCHDEVTREVADQAICFSFKEPPRHTQKKGIEFLNKCKRLLFSLVTLLPCILCGMRVCIPLSSWKVFWKGNFPNFVASKVYLKFPRKLFLQF